MGGGNFCESCVAMCLLSLNDHRTYSAKDEILNASAFQGCMCLAMDEVL